VIWRRCSLPKVCPSRVRWLSVEIADFGVRPLAGHIKPGEATCRIGPTINANLTVTPPIFSPRDCANRSASASAYLPSKCPGCRRVTQDFPQSVSGQHGQPKYLSRRAVFIGNSTKRLEGISLTMLGMQHRSCRRLKRSVNHHEAPMSKADMAWCAANVPFRVKRTCRSHCRMSAFGPKRTF